MTGSWAPMFHPCPQGPKDSLSGPIYKKANAKSQPAEHRAQQAKSSILPTQHPNSADPNLIDKSDPWRPHPQPTAAKGFAANVLMQDTRATPAPPTRGLVESCPEVPDLP